jgi:hypothetical protein
MLYLPRSRKIVEPRYGLQGLGLKGRLRAILNNVETGEVRRYLNRNIIVQDGLATIPLSIYQARAAYITQIGVGSGITTPADTDTGLTTEVLVKAITIPIDTANLTGATPYTIATVQFNTGEANGDLAEAAQFDSTDDIFNHALFGRGTVTAATAADPVVITSADHGLSSGDRVRFDSVGGMTQLNWTTNGNVYYYVTVLSSSTFSLYVDAGLSDTLDGSGFSAFTSGGTWTVVIPKTSVTILQVSFEIEASNA